MAEQHPAIRRHEVVTVVEAFGGRCAVGIEAEDAIGEKLRVKAITDRIGADGARQEPGGADRLAAGQRQDSKRRGAEQGDYNPCENRKRSHAA